MRDSIKQNKHKETEEKKSLFSPTEMEFELFLSVIDKTCQIFQLKHKLFDKFFSTLEILFENSFL